MGRTPESTADDTVQQDDGTEPEAKTYALYVLFTVEEAQRGHVHRLPKDTTHIGRKVPSESDLNVRDPAVSKVHAEVTWSPVRECYLLGDLRSSNGTHLNGTKVDRELLQPGDIIRVGDTVLKFAAFHADAVGWAPPEHSVLVGRSLSLRRSLERAGRAAEAMVSVLIQGETGTGKELLAQTVHALSGREGPLRALNCAAIPAELVESELFGHVKGAFSGADVARAGLFRAADGGTLFLDEVGELAADTQAKLLRALETKQVRPVGATAEQPVDVRIVAATNRNLEDEIEAGRFRADLYARLAEWIIVLDPLRERPEDLSPIWDHFMSKHGGDNEYLMKGAVFDTLARHHWPYNVREVSRLVQNIVLSHPDGGTIKIADLPEAMRATAGDEAGEASGSHTPAPVLPPKGEPPTARELRRLVEEFAGNVKEVASFLGKDRTQVYRWLKRHGIDPNAYRS